MKEQFIPLTKLQKEIMLEFYSSDKTKVIFDKSERDEIWKKAKARNTDIDFENLKQKCPALVHQIQKSYETGSNIQSAVFSECVYAQTLANIMKLNKFVNCYEEKSFIPEKVAVLLKSYGLTPRYAYSNNNKARMLIQAGGYGGIDSALITVIDLNIYTIEFKEQWAKTSEPDLPKYNEDGSLPKIDKWLEIYPQFKAMLDEHRNINFFEIMGKNVHDFSQESVVLAITNNYMNKKKYADVICTEDANGFLVMLPSNQISFWADIEGEIRPAGRNYYHVWTPVRLKTFLLEKNARIDGNIAHVHLSMLEKRKERGGNDISGYKITPLFFVYVKDCIVDKDELQFNIQDVQQLNPTIAGKMSFHKLKYDDVKGFYEKQLINL